MRRTLTLAATHQQCLASRNIIYYAFNMKLEIGLRANGNSIRSAVAKTNMQQKQQKQQQTSAHRCICRISLCGCMCVCDEFLIRMYSHMCWKDKLAAAARSR